MPDISALLLEVSAAAAPGSIPGVSLGGGILSLRAIFGQDEANLSAAQYPVDDGEFVRVPLEVASDLLAHGFACIFEEKMLALDRAKSSLRNPSDKG
jgi:hypothetical protein